MPHFSRETGANDVVFDELLSCEETALSDALAALVGQAFPALNLEKPRLDASGGDHILLIVHDTLAFRFPRLGMHGLDLEIAVLKNLQGRSTVATPAYQYVDPGGRFAGYHLIEGSALTPARFAALLPIRQRGVLETAALFLAILHELPATVIAPLEEWPITSMPADHGNWEIIRYLPTIARRFPEQAWALKTFYNRYRKMTVPRRVVVHGDLVAEHILVDEQTGRLCGIIDFSDVALGDPAEDFLGFWAYGADAVRQLVELYPLAGKDAGLLARSRAHFIRCRLDRLFENMDNDETDPKTVAAEIDLLLTI